MVGSEQRRGRGEDSHRGAADAADAAASIASTRETVGGWIHVHLRRRACWRSADTAGASCTSGQTSLGTTRRPARCFSAGSADRSARSEARGSCGASRGAGSFELAAAWGFHASISEY